MLTITDIVKIGAWYGPSCDSNSYTKFFFNSLRIATAFFGCGSWLHDPDPLPLRRLRAEAKNNNKMFKRKLYDRKTMYVAENEETAFENRWPKKRIDKEIWEEIIEVCTFKWICWTFLAGRCGWIVIVGAIAAAVHCYCFTDDPFSSIFRLHLHREGIEYFQTAIGNFLCKKRDKRKKSINIQENFRNR